MKPVFSNKQISVEFFPPANVVQNFLTNDPKTKVLS